MSQPVTHTEREQSSRYEYAHEAQAAAPTYERHPPTHNLQDVAIQHFPPLFPEGYPSSTTSYRPEHLHPAIPQVTGYQPDRGGPGTRLQVFFQSTHDFNLLPMWQFTITLHSYRCFTSQAYSGDFHDGYMVYWVECQIPMLEVLSWTTYVHLQLDVEDSSGHRVASIPVGHFIFDVPQPALIQPGRQESPRKRKSPSDRLIAPKQPTKRASTQSLASNPRSVHSSNSPLSQSHSSPRMTFEPSNTSAPRLSKSQSKLTRSRTPDSRIPRQSREARMTDSRRNAPRKNQDTSSRVLPRLEISLTAASSSPGTSSAATPSRSISLSPTNQHPRLVRTSTLMSDSTAQSGSFTASHLPINQPDLANLELEGDLDAMADDWTDEEKSTKRRIIRFTRSQDGSTINVSFEPVTLDDIDGDGLYVSCIWWNGKQNAFVTSVDTLNLLEYLVNVRFTTKEKNRVRRNLEGLRPLTVSKSTFENRSNEDNFFRLVMGFPKPRPRNIEKDVKVFPWKDLSIALKKIIGKYSATYQTSDRAIDAQENSLASGTWQRSGNDETSYYSHAPVRRIRDEFGPVPAPAWGRQAYGLIPTLYTEVQSTRSLVPQYAPLPPPVDYQYYWPLPYVQQADATRLQTPSQWHAQSFGLPTREDPAVYNAHMHERGTDAAPAARHISTPPRSQD